MIKTLQDFLGADFVDRDMRSSEAKQASLDWAVSLFDRQGWDHSYEINHDQQFVVLDHLHKELRVTEPGKFDLSRVVVLGRYFCPSQVSELDLVALAKAREATDVPRMSELLKNDTIRDAVDCSGSPLAVTGDFFLPRSGKDAVRTISFKGAPQYIGRYVEAGNVLLTDWDQLPDSARQLVFNLNGQQVKISRHDVGRTDVEDLAIRHDLFLRDLSTLAANAANVPPLPTRPAGAPGKLLPMPRNSGYD